MGLPLEINHRNLPLWKMLGPPHTVSLNLISESTDWIQWVKIWTSSEEAETSQPAGWANGERRVPSHPPSLPSQSHSFITHLRMELNLANWAPCLVLLPLFLIAPEFGRGFFIIIIIIWLGERASETTSKWKFRLDILLLWGERERLCVWPGLASHWATNAWSNSYDFPLFFATRGTTFQR